MDMSRYGGMASVGRMITDDEIAKSDPMYDSYAPPRKRSLISAPGAAVIGGGGIAALGAHQWTQSKNVPRDTTTRYQAATTRNVVAQGRRERALTEAARAEAAKTHARRGTGWMHRGKVRSARRTLEAASIEADRTKALMAQHANVSTPEVQALRTKRMRRGGKAMVAGGLGLAASPLIFNKADDRRRTSRDAGAVVGAGLGAAGAGEVLRRTSHREVRQALHDPVKYDQMTDKRFGQLVRRYKTGTALRPLGAGAALGGAAIGLRSMKRERDAGVSKTITQARYGGNAEMGRRWRGEEKKDRKTPAIAAAGLGVGAAGGATALAGRNKLRNVGPKVVAAPARDVAPLQTAHSAALSSASRAAADRGASEGRLSAVKQQHADWVDRDKSRKNSPRKHPLEGQPAPGHPGRGKAPAGKVGPRGGGIEHHQAIHEADFASSHANWEALDRRAADAKRSVSAAEAHNAGRHAAADKANAGRKAAIKGSKRLIRGGAGVAAVGGLAAVAAGVKAERDRGTGFGKPVRRRVPVQMSDAQRRANGL